MRLKLGKGENMAIVKWATTLTSLATILIMAIPFSTSEVTFDKVLCSDSASYVANSSFANNLKALFGSLAANATDAPTGFFSTSVGGGTDNETAYGDFLCRGDLNRSRCHECVSTAVREHPLRTNKSCHLNKAARMYYDECLLRYDYLPIYGIVSSVGGDLMTNTENMTGDENSFEELLGKTINELAAQAADGSPETGKKYANVAVNLTGWFQKLYSMAQCTPDLSAGDCSSCFQKVINKLASSSSIKRGARVLHPNCNVRYETYPFLDDGTQAFNSSFPTAPPSNTTNSIGGHKKAPTGVIIAIVVSVATILLILLALGCCLINKKKKIKKYDIVEAGSGEDISIAQTLQYDLATLELATNKFSIENKLGEGGFGGVYKGTLTNGQIIAVKKLSKSSSQGTQEFKNEVMVVARLQHRNLVRLLGFCLTGEEKLLVYEYVPNKSLDHFLFNPELQGHLNWGLRYKIIGGIARGMLYLHQDSRLRIIHRDLKASNILLDEYMNPKISDFGMAKIFGMEQTVQDSTSRIVGTYGYMAPEYVRRGRFSIKSDVYSFGVIMLEIISGMRNNSLYQSNHGKDLFSFAWKVWEKATPLDFVDPSIKDECSGDEVMRCLHLALLCIDESAEARPTMATIVLALDSYSVTLHAPRQPMYYCETESKFTQVIGDQANKSSTPSSSQNEVSITELHPR